MKRFDVFKKSGKAKRKFVRYFILLKSTSYYYVDYLFCRNQKMHNLGKMVGGGCGNLCCTQVEDGLHSNWALVIMS